MNVKLMVEVLEGREVPSTFAVSDKLLSDGSLQVRFTEQGLPPKVVVDEVLTGTGNATYTWYNKGGKVPQGDPFQSAVESFNVSGLWLTSRNGTTGGYLTVPPPGPSSDFIAQPHASNWVMQIQVSYYNVVLTDGSNSTPVPSISGTVFVSQ